MRVTDEALGRMWASKLGLPPDIAAARQAASALWRQVERLLASQPTDWTLFWRQLSEVPAAAAESDAVLLLLIEPSWYEPQPDERMRAEWVRWLRKWLESLSLHPRAFTRDATAATEEIVDDAVAIGEAMRQASPKYIPREWMLVEAYEAAERGDFTPLHALHSLLRRPYDEQPEAAPRFYRRRPEGAEQQGGVGFMS